MAKIKSEPKNFKMIPCPIGNPKAECGCISFHLQRIVTKNWVKRYGIELSNKASDLVRVYYWETLEMNDGNFDKLPAKKRVQLAVKEIEHFIKTRLE